ncbi:OmpA family protein [Yoonia sp. 2307UL14-13]|uniref:OmpA family protein n=1 Tax=Yoonia sp. 2307UL14-13 TaxID=3126506 RepID=UPI0030B5612B
MVRIGLVACVVVLTGLTFLFATWSLSDDLDREGQLLSVVETQETERLKSQLAELEAANENGKSQIDNLTQTNATLSAQVADLQAEMANAVGSADELGALSETNAVLTARIESLEAEMAFAASDVAESDQMIASLTEEIVAARESKQAIEEQLALANTDVEALTTRIAELESETVALSQNSTDQTIALRAEVDALKDELDVSKQRVASLITEADEKAGMVSELTARAEGSEAEIATLNGQIAQLSTELETRTAEVRAATEALALAESEAAAAIATASANAQPVAPAAVDSEAAQPAETAVGSAAPTQTLAFCNERSLTAFAGQKLEFENDTATMTVDASAALEGFTDIVQRCTRSGHSLLIGSHTDSKGSSQSNLTLSQSRADAVAEFLIARGIPGSALQGVGYGEEDPIASNGTIEGRAENRRITFEWQ